MHGKEGQRGKEREKQSGRNTGTNARRSGRELGSGDVGLGACRMGQKEGEWDTGLGGVMEGMGVPQTV